MTLLVVHGFAVPSRDRATLKARFELSGKLDSSFLGSLKELCGVTASSFGLSSKRSPLLKTRGQLPRNGSLISGAGLHRTHRTALLDVHLGAITRGLGGGLRRLLRGAGLGQPRWLTRWRASFIAQSWAPLLDESTALSGAAPRPQRAQSRATTQRARTLGIAAGSDHIGKLQSIQPSATIGVLPPTSTPHTVGPALEYYSQYCQHSAMVGLTLEVSTAPYPTLAGAAHAPGPRRPLSDGPRSESASTPGSPRDAP